jgi:hypothetical protein
MNSLANFNRFNPVLKIQAMTAESIPADEPPVGGPGRIRS